MRKFIYSFMPAQDYIGLYVEEDGSITAEVKNMVTEKQFEMQVTDCFGRPTMAPRAVLLEQVVLPDHDGTISKKFADICLCRVSRELYAPKHEFRVMKK